MKGREILAVVIMSALGVLAIMVVNYLAPTKDNTNIDTMIIGFLAPTILSLLTTMKSADNAAKLESMHTDLQANSAMTGSMVDTLKAQTPSVTTIITEEKKS